MKAIGKYLLQLCILAVILGIVQGIVSHFFDSIPLEFGLGSVFGYFCKELYPKEI